MNHSVWLIVIWCITQTMVQSQGTRIFPFHTSLLLGSNKSTCKAHVKYMLSTCNHVGVNKPIKIRSREKTNHSILLEIKKRFYEYFIEKEIFLENLECIQSFSPCSRLYACLQSYSRLLSLP